ncbi:Sensor protein ZraS [Thalassocella blandensis]|nr:Sensor protein ZraS [Thalassocella blandensis]
MENSNYKAAYERQKAAREQADRLLEKKSKELQEINDSMRLAYSRLKNQKVQILHQEKLASIGQLSAGIAHEINNPTAYIKSNLNVLLQYRDTLQSCFQQIQEASSANQGGDNSENRDIQDIITSHEIGEIMEDFKDIITESLDGILKISDIVKGLRDFSRPDSDEMRPFDVNSSIASTLKLVSSEVKNLSELRADYGDIDLAMGFQGGFAQVMLNLIVNATHAVKADGIIKIKTFQRQDKIVIEVMDNGEGIPVNVIHKIFDPFFTTKQPGVGTGLGLSVSLGIIESQKGTLDVQSEVGVGTKFTITLLAQQ